jgi:hypothetical protein
MARWLWIALVPALAVAGCGKKEDPGPPCAKVADHVTEVVAKAYPGHADMMPAAAHKNWVASCETRKFTGKERRCMMDAQTPDALASCIRARVNEKKPEGARGVPPMPGTPPGAAPAGAAPTPTPTPTPTPPATVTPAPSATPTPAPPAPGGTPTPGATPTPAPPASPTPTPTPPTAPAAK